MRNEYHLFPFTDRLPIAVPQNRGAAIQLYTRIMFPVVGVDGTGLPDAETQASDVFP